MNPMVIIRLGSHAEKEYILKSIKLLDGLIIAANLIEATPAATPSLIAKTSGKRFSVPYYIDPMTYAFGTYAERGSKQIRADLDWIKSDQKIKGTDDTQRDFKRSYRALSERFGGPFKRAVRDSKAITPRDFSQHQVVRDTSRSIVEYQLTRIRDEFSKDPDFKDYASELPTPAAFLAPYFYAEPSDFDAWNDVNLELASAAVSFFAEVPIHAILCVDRDSLSDSHYLDTVKKSLPETGVKAVWLWFSRLQEDYASVEQLQELRSLVESLSKHMQVFNLHGGFFSLALSSVGFSGISHGVGYGEQKDVIPVIGQSVPTVRYYLPEIYKRVGVPDVERCFNALGIAHPSDFHREVCACVVCKGVVSKSVASFSEFGEMHFSRPSARRLAQKPAAAKRCRFHFLLTRFRERDEQSRRTLQETRERMKKAREKWGSQPSLMDESKHLDRWISALE